MRKLNLVCMFLLIIVLMACKKEGTVTALPDGSISFDVPSTSDVIEMPTEILANVTTTLQMKAALMGNTSTESHNITFSVDTSKISGYIAKYGSALVLPTSTYLFYKPLVKLAAGESKSESALLNIGQQMTLKEYSTYVLPVVIKAVDGKTDGAATGRVIYYVFKTGKPFFVNKSGWTITASSQNNATTNAATGLLDANNTGTYWLSAPTASMPQWVNINFNRDVDITQLIYYFPTALSYPKNGAYPTSMQIETSMDGTIWVNRGLFTGSIVNTEGTFQQTLDMGGTIKARYLRFTVLSCVKYAATFDAVAIAGISLKP
jgi:hypothetical protein